MVDPISARLRNIKSMLNCDYRPHLVQETAALGANTIDALCEALDAKLRMSDRLLLEAVPTPEVRAVDEQARAALRNARGDG